MVVIEHRALETAMAVATAPVTSTLAMTATTAPMNEALWWSWSFWLGCYCEAHLSSHNDWSKASVTVCYPQHSVTQ